MKIQKIYTLFLAIIFALTGITVSAQSGWSVNPNQYVYSMTITGKITIDNELSLDVNDQIGAFINGECRGVVNVKYQKALDDYFVFLMIYSNDPTGTVSFKIYDADKGVEFPAKETINFTVNDIVGSVSNPFIFSARTLSDESKLLSFTIPRQEGSTLIKGNDVYVQENWAGNLKGIVASFTTSVNAKVYVGGVLQTSGSSVNDFVTTVKYTVVSEDLSTTTDYMVHITEANDLPTDILLSNNKKPENDNTAYIGSFSAVTPNPDETHSFTLINGTGTDNSKFNINTSGALRANSAFNYEEKSSYRIYVKADDGKGGVVSKYFTIEITDENDAPTNIALINVSTPDLVVAGEILGKLVAIDEDTGDTHTFVFKSGDGNNDKDNGKFTIEGNQLISKEQLTFADENEYYINVQTSDKKGATITVALVIGNKDNGSAPHSLVLSNTIVDISGVLPVLVGELSAEDADQQIGLIFSLPANHSEGPDNVFFEITGGQLFLASPLPAEEKMTYQIVLAVTDSVGNELFKTFEITVKEQTIEGFFLSKNELNENQPFNTIVGYFDSQTKQSSDYNFNLPLEVDLDTYCNNEFTLKGRTLLTNQVFDFEKEKSVIIQLEITGGEEKIKQDVTVYIIDQNDPPTSISLSTQLLSESTQLQAVVATLGVEDQDEGDTHEFSLVLGNGINDEGNSLFRIQGNELVLSKPLDYEDKEFHNVLLRVTDNKGATFEQGLRLQVADANDAPMIRSTPASYVLQDQVYVYALDVKDSEGDSISFRFDGLPDWLTFNPGSKLLSGVAGNEWVGEHVFNIIVSDGNKESVQQVVISVINVNDPPEVNYFPGQQHFFTRQMNEVVLPLDVFTEPDTGDELKYTLSGENNTALPAWLTFDPVTLKLSGTPPENASGIYRLKFTATDKGKLKEWVIFELMVSVTTAAGDLDNNQMFMVYPNPVRNQLHLQIPNGKKDAQLTITNLAGQTVKSRTLSSGSIQTVQMDDVSPGVYLISLTQGENVQVKKLVKE